MAMKALLQDRNILVVEDEYLIAYTMQCELQNLGARVIGPVSSVKDALALLDSEPVDGATLDINLNDEKVFPVAEALTALGVPFVFMTGYSAANLPTTWQHISRFEKPVHASEAALALVHTDVPDCILQL